MANKILSGIKLLLHKADVWIRTRFVAAKVPSSKVIIFVDIDNTLADTWPSLLKFYNNDFDRLISLRPFERMVEWVNKSYDEGKFVILLTHRTLKQRKVTLQWLEKNRVKYHQLIITTDPEEKVRVISAFFNHPCYVIDDLSYAHEKGEVKYYDEVIQSLNELNVKYIGKMRIDDFNQGKLECLW